MNTLLATKAENRIDKYIFTVPELEKMNYVALVVNTGSAWEQESEAGLAHFLEHVQMSFFTNERVTYESYAHTDYYSTTFYFDTCNEQLSEVIKVVQNILDGTYIHYSNIDHIRKDILEEYEMFQKKNMKADFRVLLQKSEYENHLSIGNKECIFTFQKHHVWDFFERYYHLDNIAIIWVANPYSVSKIGTSWIDNLSGRFGGITNKMLRFHLPEETIVEVLNEKAETVKFYFYNEERTSDRLCDGLILKCIEILLQTDFPQLCIEKILLSPCQEFIKVVCKKGNEWKDIYQNVLHLSREDIRNTYNMLWETEDIGCNCNSIREELVKSFVFQSKVFINPKVKLEKDINKIFKLCEKPSHVII